MRLSWRAWFLVRAAGAFALCLAVASPAAAAARFEPADGVVISGVAPEYPPSNAAAFAAMTGQPSVAVYHRYTSWLEPFSNLLPDSGRVNAAAMISWRMFAANPGQAGGTHESIANGGIDAYLIAQAAAVRSFGRPVFLRPNWEMNGDWFPWSTYNQSGATRPGNSPAGFRRSWQRARIIFDGGSKGAIDGRLAAAGLPPVQTSAASLPPTTNAAWVWSVAKGGVKQPSKPHDTIDYYPGDAYVDWVATGLHQFGSDDLARYTSRASNTADPLARTDDLYAEFSGRRGKPFMLSEWGVATRPYGNGDDPSYVRDVFAWIRAHPKVKASIYFNRKHGNYTHELEAMPQARAAYADELRKTRMLYDWRAIPLDGSSGGGAAPPAPLPPTGSGTKPRPRTSPGAGPKAACAMPRARVVRTRSNTRVNRRIAGRHLTFRLTATRRWVKGVVTTEATAPARIVVRRGAARITAKGPRTVKRFGLSIRGRAISTFDLRLVRRGKTLDRVRVVVTSRRSVPRSLVAPGAGGGTGSGGGGGRAPSCN